MKCSRCRGCGQIANSEDGEPWIDWESLPEPSKLAMRLGLVAPIPCPECEGTGEQKEGNRVDEKTNGESSELEEALAEALSQDAFAHERRGFWRDAYLAVLRHTGNRELARMGADFAVKDLDAYERGSEAEPPEPEQDEPRYLGQS